MLPSPTVLNSKGHLKDNIFNKKENVLSLTVPFISKYHESDLKLRFNGLLK